MRPNSDLSPMKNPIHAEEVQRHLDYLRLRHARMMGEAPPPLRHVEPPKPRPDRKVSTTIRLCPDILEAFKADGPGWQTRINDALRKSLDLEQAACHAGGAGRERVQML